jgi:tol-pal system protein YbgF
VIRPLRHTSALFLIALCSCGFSKEDGQRLQGEVYGLLTQVNAMQQAMTELQAERKKQSEALEKLDKEVAQLNQAARRNDADLGVQLDEAMQQVARMKGLVESSTERLSELESSVQKVQEELDLRFQNMQEQARVKELTEKDKAKVAEDARKQERLLGSAGELFAEVEKLIAAGNPADARKLLREYTIRAKSDKTAAKNQAEAVFYIGETYYAEGNFQQAAAEYNNVRKNHPKSSKVPEALYKLGQCFEKLKLPDDAKLFYQTVREKYPKSSVAKDAKARLDALK